MNRYNGMEYKERIKTMCENKESIDDIFETMDVIKGMYTKKFLVEKLKLCKKKGYLKKDCDLRAKKDYLFDIYQRIVNTYKDDHEIKRYLHEEFKTST